VKRLAGLALPLAALRGARDPGIGELGDLVPFAEWAAAMGQRLIGLLPLGESAPGEASPYSALSSFAIDPLHVSVDALPELAGERPPEPPASLGLLLDRERTYAWKRPCFERAFAAFERLPADHERRRAFDRFRADHSAWLDDYALFRALCEEQHWRSWREWPGGLAEDVAITYENEVLSARASGLKTDYVVPPATLWIDNPVAVVTRYAEAKGTTAVANAFVDYLRSEDAQRAFARFGYRPVVSGLTGIDSTLAAPVPGAFTIEDLGGWPIVIATVFAADGMFARALSAVRR
jgi:hypothetical protein